LHEESDELTALPEGLSAVALDLGYTLPECSEPRLGGSGNPGLLVLRGEIVFDALQEESQVVELDSEGREVAVQLPFGD